MPLVAQYPDVTHDAVIAVTATHAVMTNSTAAVLSHEHQGQKEHILWK